jgi:signal peptidase I
MSEVVAQAKKKPIRKIVSSAISWVLGALILLLLGCQIAMLTSSSYKEYGVPSLFGYSFMQVKTDSMNGTASDSLPTYTGIVVQKIDPKEVRPNDIITFKSSTTTSTGQSIVVSHRVREVMVYPSAENEQGSLWISSLEEFSTDGVNWTASTGLSYAFDSATRVRVRLQGNVSDSTVTYIIPGYTSNTSGLRAFYTIGDYLNAQTCPEGGCPNSYRDNVSQANLIGKVIYHSNFLGTLLGAAMSNWFVPVCCLVPLAIIVTFSAIDLVKEGRGEQAEEERQILLAANKAGVDPNDERAYLLFSEKERYKIQVREQLEKTKEEERKRILREMKKKGNGTATMEVKS